MTTPRDDIAGLIDRLQSHVNDRGGCFKDDEGNVVIPNGAWSMMLESATQLDSLLKERDALQARVKELEARQADDLAEFGLMEMRALCAEQERDEAYERAIQAIRSAPTPDANGYVVTKDAAIKAIRRLAAGPEKEK